MSGDKFERDGIDATLATIIERQRINDDRAETFRKYVFEALEELKADKNKRDGRTGIISGLTAIGVSVLAAVIDRFSK